MKILYLEDESALSEWTANELRAIAELKEAGYEINDFFRVDQAKEFYDDNQGDIALIITDLNMDDRWLGEHKAESHGGFLTGAVWLQHFVFENNPATPTIIYSAYCDLLRKEKAYLITDNVQCVEKGVGEDFGFEGLIKAIEKVLGFSDLLKKLQEMYLNGG